MSIVIRKGEIARKRKDQEAAQTKETASHVKAVQDYNIMMGILEDPGEEDEEDE